MISTDGQHSLGNSSPVDAEPASVRRNAAALFNELAGLLANRSRRSGSAVLIGICGTQGSGKSTISASLASRFESNGFRTVVLSIDDFYLPKGERMSLASRVHPLLAVRGPPGTHDIALAEHTIGQLIEHGRALVPLFDKAADDRAKTWRQINGPIDLIIFEGWFVGALPQKPEQLTRAINALEQEHDPDGLWRRYTNQALAGYQRLFSLVDFQILLLVPSFDVVAGWRRHQEQTLRCTRPEGPALMSDHDVTNFVAHYERLTREIMREMPHRADLVVQLDENRSFKAIRSKS